MKKRQHSTVGDMGGKIDQEDGMGGSYVKILTGLCKEEKICNQAGWR